MDNIVSVIISLDTACADSSILDRVLSDCTAIGFQPSKKNLANIGVLAGCVCLEKIADLRRVPHVRSVDLDKQRRMQA